MHSCHWCRHAQHEHRQLLSRRRKGLLLSVITTLALLQQGLAAEPPSLENSTQDESLGYQYEGQVEFVHGAKPVIPRVKLDADSKVRGVGEHRTVLIKRDGSKYTKRLAVHPSEQAVQQAQATRFTGKLPEQPEIWESEPVPMNVTSSRRRLNQAAQIVIASTSNDLSCVGCDSTDTRTRVNPTNVYPFSALGQLIGTLSGSTSGLECSGTLIGTKHVITAAHCVYDINESKQYVDALDFSAGQNGNTAPYGTVAWDTVRVLSQFTGEASYTSTAMEYDFALVTLSEPVSTATGYLAMFFPPSSGTKSVNIQTAGYPGDKASGTMWTSSCTSISFDYSGAGPTAFSNIAQCGNGGCANIVNHHCLSSDGQSGSGMWDPDYVLRAVLSGKVATNDGSEYNVGTMIDNFVYNTVATWYNEDGGDNGNTSLPLTPSTGTPGSPTRSSSGLKNLKISTPWVVAVIAAGGGLLVVAIAVWIWTCCQRKNRAAQRAKRVQQPSSTAGLGWDGATPAYGQNPAYGQSPYQASPSRRQYSPPTQEYRGNGQQQEYGGYPQAAGGYPQNGEEYQGEDGYGPGPRGQEQGGYGQGSRGPQQMGSHPQGVVYDERTGQFLVNGIPYGQYQYN